METSGFRQSDTGPLTYIYSEGFPLVHAFFQRTGGLSGAPYESFNAAWVTEDGRAPDNRRLLYERTGMELDRVYLLNPSHGRRTAFAKDLGSGGAGTTVFLKTDAVVTQTPGAWVMMSSADCIPLLLTDDALSFAGLAHFGWRNVAGDLADVLLQDIRDVLGVPAERLRFVLGPAIRPCCYEFGGAVQRGDPFWAPFIRPLAGGRLSVDIASALRARLALRGVPPGSILDSHVCTCCESGRYFSRYREGGASGRFPTVVQFREAAGGSVAPIP